MADRYWILGTGTWSSTNQGNWSGSSGGGGGASVPTAADNVFFDANSNIGTGAFTVTMATTPRVCNDLTISGLDGVMTLAGASIGLTVSGSLTFPATNFTRSYTGATTFNATTTGKTVTTNGVAFGGIVAFDGFGGAWALGSALTSSGATGVINGSLNLNNFTFTGASFNSSYTNIRSIAFGTGNITCTGTGTVWDTATATNLTTTGTQVVNVTSVGSTAINVAPGALSEANSISYTFTGGTYALTFLNISGYTARNVDFTGYAGTLGANGNVSVFGNLTLASGMTLTASANTMTFGATSGTKTITTNGKTLDFPLTFNGVGGTWQLQDNMTVGATRTTTLTNGSLDLFNNTLSTGIFSSDGSNTRSIAFGTTGSIVPTTTTAATTVLAMATATNFTFTGTSNITAAMSVTRTFNFGGTAGATTSNRLNVNTTSGASVPTFTGSFRQLNFTGSTTSFGSPTISCHGFTLASGGTYTSVRFITVGDGTLTYTGKTISTLDISGTGITTTLNSAGQQSTLTLVNGTIDLAGYTLTTSSAVQTSAGTKNITFNGGTLIVGSNFANSNPTGFTTTAGTGTGVISMTSASSKTMTGSSTYNCTLNQGGAGNLNITSSNTFSDITNTVQPASIIFTAGTTNTFNNFSLSGTAGNLITIGSATAASHTLSKASGTVSSSYLSISRSNATGGATWEAFFSNGNVDGGNNTGWDFGGIAYAVIIFETATATDAPSVAASTFNAPVAETATATDSPSVAASTFNAPIVETATATDSILGQAAFNSALSETATATDSPSVAASTFNAPVSETATATDTVISFADFYATLSETATATDSVLSFADFYAALSEAATATDSILGLSDLFVSLEETATATDSPLVAPSTFNAPVAETATATDAVSPPGSIYNAPVSETVTISDFVLGAYLWNLIDDSQSVTWQNVNSSPGTTWSPIDTDPDTGWSVIPTVN